MNRQKKKNMKNKKKISRNFLLWVLWGSFFYRPEGSANSFNVVLLKRRMHNMENIWQSSLSPSLWVVKKKKILRNRYIDTKRVREERQRKQAKRTERKRSQGMKCKKGKRRMWCKTEIKISDMSILSISSRISVYKCLISSYLYKKWIKIRHSLLLWKYSPRKMIKFTVLSNASILSASFCTYQLYTKFRICVVYQNSQVILLCFIVLLEPIHLLHNAHVFWWSKF